MRWVSVVTIALLLASVQCLSACTLASCAPAPKDAQLPPCHQHHQTPAPASDQHNNCDHQKAVSAPSADLAMAHLGVVAPPVFLPELMAAAALAPAAHLVLESPPGLVTPSVLRI
jgi:hypothetical protein